MDEPGSDRMFHKWVQYKKADRQGDETVCG